MATGGPSAAGLNLGRPGLSTCEKDDDSGRKCQLTPLGVMVELAHFRAAQTRLLWPATHRSSQPKPPIRRLTSPFVSHLAELFRQRGEINHERQRSGSWTPA